jgi:lipopolysaccharide biosynthesis glycosyltransferase
MSIAFFTIVARNYFAYACVLGDSVKKFHPDAEFYVFIMDDLENELGEEASKRDFHLISPSQISIDNYKNFVFKYNVTEAATGVKPFVFEYLLKNDFDKVVYLDPDILCFRRLTELIEELDSYSIIITPHSTSPVVKEEIFPDDYVFLTIGVYNLGFIAVRNNDISINFVKWWKRKLSDYCISQPEIGLFVDQKWIDLIPAYFDNVLIFRNRSYNMAYWNLHERILEFKNDTFTVSGSGLAFFHFSGFQIDNIDKIFKYGPKNPLGIQQKEQERLTLRKRPDLLTIFQNYRDLLFEADMNSYSKIPYAYSVYDNNEKITQLERSIFFKLSLNNFKECKKINFKEPFSTSIDSFWSISRRSGITSESNDHPSLSISEVTNKYSKYYTYIHFILKILLKFMGVSLYLKFSKFLRFQLLSFNHDFLIKKY